MPRKSSKSRRWSLKYLIVCDEVRFEGNGKEIILGVYDDVILVPSVPTKLKVLTLRIVLNVDGGDFRRVHFQIRGSHGAIGAEVETAAPDDMIGKREVKMFFELPGISLKTAGVKTVWLGLDSEPEKIGEFEVRAISQGLEHELNA